MTAPFVLDASLAAAWLFADERTYETESLRHTATTTFMLVPSIFPAEMQNILWTGEMRRRITAADANAFWTVLRGFDIRVAPSSNLTDEPSLLLLSRQLSLASYDAAYLELALTNKLALATLDVKLRTAARALALQTLPR